MPFSTLRRILAAFAMVAPLSAAHPTEPTPAPLAAAIPANGFEGAFGEYRQLPAPAPVADGAVDLATIEHRHADASPGESGVGKRLAGGSASFYAARFHGRRTASGEAFDNAALTAAHRTLPFGSRVRVTNPANGRSVVVRINDRGPFHKDRTIDVSRAAAERLGLVARGHGQVELALVD